MRTFFTVDTLFLTILGIAGVYEHLGQPDVALEMLANILHHPQYGSPVLGATVGIFLKQIQFRISAEQIKTVMEKAKQGQLSGTFLESHFTVSPQIIERLFQFLDEVANR